MMGKWWFTIIIGWLTLAGLVSGCESMSHYTILKALCNDGSTDIKLFQNNDLTEEEHAIMVRQVEKRLCAVHGVFKRRPDVRQW